MMPSGNGVEKELKDVRRIMLRYKEDYLGQIVKGQDNSYLYADFCEDIERYVEPAIMRLVAIKKLEINEAKRFLADIFDMAIDVHLEAEKKRYLLHQRIWNWITNA